MLPCSSFDAKVFLHANSPRTVESMLNFFAYLVCPFWLCLHEDDLIVLDIKVCIACRNNRIA